MSASGLALDDKVWPVNKHLKDGIPTHWVSWNWDLNPRAMRKWVTREMKQDILHGSAGRPVPLMNSSKEKLLDYVLGFTTYDRADFEHKIHTLQLELAVGENTCQSQVSLIEYLSMR